MPRRDPPEEQLRSLALKSSPSMAPRTRAQRQTQGPNRLQRVQELVHLFQPTSAAGVSGNGPLQQVRDDLHREIITILEGAAARDDLAYDELNRPPMTDFRTIEEARHGILRALAAYRQQSPGHSPPTEAATIQELRVHERRISDIQRLENPRRDRFAVGVLVLLLDELIKLAESADARLRILPQALLRPGVDEGHRLPLFEHIEKYDEMVLGSYLEQIEDILERTRSLPEAIRPPMQLIQSIEGAIRPLVRKRAEETEEAETSYEESD